MVAVCNVCPGATKAIVWFKFSDTIWRSYRPSTFPFAYNAIDNGDGTYTLKFYRRPNVSPKPYKVYFNYINNATNTMSHGLATHPANTFFWGDPATVIAVTKEISSGVFRWYVQGQDVCGNLLEYLLFTSSGNYQLSPIAGSSTVVRTKGNVNFDSRSLLSSPPYNCGQCPSGWELAIGEISGQGDPQIQVICNADACPPDTACSCTKNGVTCCYDSLGNPIYSFKS